MLLRFDAARYFEKALGRDDHLATGKREIASRLLSERGLDPRSTLFVGDTVHDAEVAQTLGCGWALLATGHHAAARLRATGGRVFASLGDLQRFVLRT